MGVNVALKLLPGAQIVPPRTGHESVCEAQVRTLRKWHPGIDNILEWFEYRTAPKTITVVLFRFCLKRSFLSRDCSRYLETNANAFEQLSQKFLPKGLDLSKRLKALTRSSLVEGLQRALGASPARLRKARRIGALAGRFFGRRRRGAGCRQLRFELVESLRTAVAQQSRERLVDDLDTKPERGLLMLVRSQIVVISTAGVLVFER